MCGCLFNKLFIKVNFKILVYLIVVKIYEINNF